MDLSKAASVWRRWWVLTVLLLLLASAATAGTLTKLRTYQSDSSVLLLASRSAARLAGGNPYLSFSSSLTLTADAVSREVMAPAVAADLVARGFPDSYSVTLAPFTTNTTGSVLLVTVTGAKKAVVEPTLRAVTSEISTVLLQLQNGVKPRNLIHAVTLSYTPQATIDVSGTVRPVVVVAAVGLLLAFGMPVVADGMLARRRIRRGALSSGRASELAGPVLADQPANGRPAGHGRVPAGRQPTMTGAHVEHGRYR